MSHESEPASSTELGSSPQPRPASANTLLRFVLGTLAGLALGLIVALFMARAANYDPTPTLTPEPFELAHKRWRANPPPDYDIEIHVTGPQASVYRASVRAGEPQAAWRNRQPLTTRRTFGTWSVPGMFSTMGRDVATIEMASAKGAQQPLILRASFNAQYGYPERYRRIDNGSRRGSDSITVTWDVTHFQALSPGSPITAPEIPSEPPVPANR